MLVKRIILLGQVWGMFHFVKNLKKVVSERKFIHPRNIYWTQFCVRRGFHENNSDLPTGFLVLWAEKDMQN